MKLLFVLFLFTLTAFAQNDSIAPQNISVISAEKLNVVYRGVDNPIKIAVPGVTSFTATAPGMRKDSIKGPGNYIINPGPGNELYVSIVYQLPDGASKSERKTFRILGLPAPIAAIKGYAYTDGAYLMTKAELKKIAVEIAFLDFLFDVEFPVTQFTIKIPKYQEIIIEGNILNNEAKNRIDKIKKGSIILIEDIRYPHSPESRPRNVGGIAIELTD